ncbi:MAG: helix-turn-helix domain-containing protein [Raoultella sp.]|nr:helix-turn-helix domain-containing protein [Raoultella sp.]
MIEHMVHEEKARKEFSQRLALACDKAGFAPHGRQAEIAKRMKLTPKAVSKWFNGESIPRRGTLQMLASLIGTSASYLLGDATNDGIETGHFSHQPDVFRLDVLDLAVSAGPGVINQEFVEILHSVEYAPAEARHMFDGRKAEHVKRLQKMKDKLLVISDNKSYAAWDPIEKDEMNRVFVFGKVIGSMPQTYRKHG